MKIKLIKEASRGLLAGRYWQLMGVLLLYIVLTQDQWYISSGDSDFLFTFFSQWLSPNGWMDIFWLGFLFFISIPLEYGKDSYFLELINMENPPLRRLFQSFTKSVYWRALGFNLLRFLYLLLWFLLFIIPGLIKYFSYEQVLRIARENPQLKANEVITRSREMMDGYKWKLFVLKISFLVWYIPAFVVSLLGNLHVAFFYIGSLLMLATGILIRPYYETAKAVFYSKLKQV